MQSIRVHSVSYLNAKPLIYGLESDPGIRLSLDVPSRLIDQLRDGGADVALLPSIDLQRMEGLRIVPAGCIGCDGPTLTVRIFSKVPAERIASLACDTDSHTSVALARIILSRRYGNEPAFVDLRATDAAARAAEAILLIGDKVACEEPSGETFPHQYDLGEEWKCLTGSPFVFAIWAARSGVELGDLHSKLCDARLRGLAAVPHLVERFALPRGWPAALATRYLTEYLKFDVGPSQIAAIRNFHELAHSAGLLDSLRELPVTNPV